MRTVNWDWFRTTSRRRRRTDQ